MTSDHHVILRVVAKVLIPIIALFGFYVHFHGEYSPGGGFQAGVILAVAVILYSLIFGIGQTMQSVTPGFARGLAAFGFLLYTGVGFAALIFGGNFLDYDALVDERGRKAAVTIADVRQSNGVIHVIDTVLLPAG